MTKCLLCECIHVLEEQQNSIKVFNASCKYDIHPSPLSDNFSSGISTGSSMVLIPMWISVWVTENSKKLYVNDLLNIRLRLADFRW